MINFSSYPTAYNGEIGEIRVDAKNQTSARADTNSNVRNFVSILSSFCLQLLSHESVHEHWRLLTGCRLWCRQRARCFRKIGKKDINSSRIWFKWIFASSLYLVYLCIFCVLQFNQSDYSGALGTRKLRTAEEKQRER